MTEVNVLPACLREEGKLAPDLVDLPSLHKGFRLDVRYATDNNFVHKAVYTEPRAVLQRPAAEALVRVAKRLEAETGFALLIYDGYRPWAVTKVFWDLTPPEKRDFVAAPGTGSKHNRGCAVDLSLCRPTAAGGFEAIDMPSDFDEMADSAHSEYGGDPTLPEGSAAHEAQTAQLKMRDLLREHMERDGDFTVQYNEWWHFNFKDWEQYPVSDIPFEEILPTV